MKARAALGKSGFAAAACVACCAPPLIGALGVTVGLAATAVILLGLAAALAVVIAGAGWTVARARRTPPGDPAGPVPVTVQPRRPEGADPRA